MYFSEHCWFSNKTFKARVVFYVLSKMGNLGRYKHHSLYFIEMFQLSLKCLQSHFNILSFRSHLKTLRKSPNYHAKTHNCLKILTALRGDVNCLIAAILFKRISDESYILGIVSCINVYVPFFLARVDTCSSLSDILKYFSIIDLWFNIQPQLTP